MDEFEELRKVDYEYRRETIMDESEKLKLALDFLGIVIYCNVLYSTSWHFSICRQYTICLTICLNVFIMLRSDLQLYSLLFLSLPHKLTLTLSPTIAPQKLSTHPHTLTHSLSLYIYIYSGEDLPTMFSLLLNPAATETGKRRII